MITETNFKLEMADGVAAVTLQELRDHFDLIATLEHYTSGELMKWLTALDCVEEAKAISAIDSTTDDFEAALCTILRVPFSMEDAIAQYTKAAEENCVEALFRLGCCCLSGDNVKKDEIRAVELLKKAAEQGHIEAQQTLGIYYSQLQNNGEEAVKWFRKAAERGCAYAQCSLGIIYSTGIGIDRDAAEGVKWFQMAAAQGDLDSEYWLGGCLMDGDGIPRNEAEGARHFLMAAVQGHAGAQCKLGLCYGLGSGVEADPDKALVWLQKAAEQGDPEAMEALDFVMREIKHLKHN